MTLRARGPVAVVPEPDEREWRSELWVVPPDRHRDETDGGLNGGHTTVRNRDVVWSFQHRNGYATSQVLSGSMGFGVDSLLEPRQLLSSHGFRFIGVDQVAGRKCYCAVITPTKEEPWRDLWPGGDGEIFVDAERGVLLRRTERIDGLPYHIQEFETAEFDTDIDESLFVFAPPTGIELRPIEDVMPFQPPWALRGPVGAFRRWRHARAIRSVLRTGRD
jgi:outer membrane lipoprotein-sorting protein